jgi:hypothetical protein
MIKVDLPNPMYPSDYQESVRRVWSSRETHGVPVFFTYAHNNDLFVILQRGCSRVDHNLSALDREIHRDERLRGFQLRPVAPAEARTILAEIEGSFPRQ